MNMSRGVDSIRRRGRKERYGCVCIFAQYIDVCCFAEVSR